MFSPLKDHLDVARLLVAQRLLSLALRLSPDGHPETDILARSLAVFWNDLLDSWADDAAGDR